jgi:hypothetical protein
MDYKTIFDDPFCYELLVHIPTRGLTLFNTVDYLTAARHLKVDFDGIHIQASMTRKTLHGLSRNTTCRRGLRGSSLPSTSIWSGERRYRSSECLF